MLTRSQFSKPHEEFNTERWYGLGTLTNCEYTPTILIDELNATGKLLNGSCKKCRWCESYRILQSTDPIYRDRGDVACPGCCGLGFCYIALYLDQDVMLPLSMGVHPNDQT